MSFHTSRSLLFGLVAIATSGCLIGQSAFENALCKLDEDGDGDPRCGLSNTVTDGDCDDGNPYMSNLRDETGTGVLDERGEDSGGAYDGLDNDCEGGDLIDVDGDGVPGISKAEYEAKGGEPWPAQYDPDLVDCHDLPIEGMPEGFEATVKPGATEIYYDGVDGDCAGGDDYDQDGDGFASIAYADVYDGDLDATDCNDNDASVNPNTPVGDEVFYDGEDQNCDGLNDFDPDGDRHLTEGYNDEATTFVDKYDYELSWTPNGDCLDLGDDFGDGTDVSLHAATTFVRFPGDGDCDEAVEEGASCEGVAYDGIDDACDDLDARGQVQRNDFDQDADGFIETRWRADFIAYVQRYYAFTDSRGEQPYRQAMADFYGDGTTVTEASIGAWFDAHDNDCDDSDPGVSPTAIEVLGDDVDQDCDGGNDTARFGFGEYIFDAPGPIRATRTEDYLVFVVNATGGVDLADGFGKKFARVVAFSWDLDAQTADPTLDGTPFNVSRTSDALHSPVAIQSGGRNYYTGISWASSRTRLQSQLSAPTTGVNFNAFTTPSPVTRTDVVEYGGTDLRCDDDAALCWHVACDGSSLQWTTFDQSTSMTYRGDGLEIGLDAQACFVLPGALSDGAGTLMYTVDATGTAAAWTDEFGLLTPASTNPLAGLSIDFVRSHDDWLIIGESSGGAKLLSSPSNQIDVFGSQRLIDADASVVTRDGAPWWAIAAITQSQTLEIAYGPASDLTRFTLPIQSDVGAVTPSSVAVSVSGSRLVVVVRGDDGTERVGWTLIETPE